MKRTLLALVVTVALLFGMAGARPALALEAVTLGVEGWSNPSVGTWDPTTGVAILEQDIAGLTVLPNIAPSVTVEGNGHLVTGSNASNSNGVNITGWTSGQLTVKNLVVSRFTRGILLYGSTGVTLQGNTTAQNGYGIYLLNSSGNTLSGNTASYNTANGIFVSGGGNNTLAQNSATNNHSDGLFLTFSNGNHLTGNALTANGQHGLFIDMCSGNSLSGNTMAQNTYDFRLDGYGNEQYAHTIDASNTVGGKPILYVVGDTSGTIYDASTTGNAGTVYLANCDGVTVRGLTLSGSHTGIRLWRTTNSVIEDIQATGNTVGIYLQSSSNNTVRRCTVSGNDWYGVYLEASDGNALSSNTIEASGTHGLKLSGSNGNTVYGNQFLANATQAYDPDGIGNLFYRADPVDDPIGGNYWSNWTTPNVDGDRFVDYPYVFSFGEDRLPLANPPSGDCIPPETTLIQGGTAGADGWYRCSVQVTLSATDDGGSGVAYSQYSFDNVAWTTYEAPFEVAAEGTTAIYYRSIDNDGNVEPAKSAELRVDCTPPAITITTPQLYAVLPIGTALDFGASDALSGVASVTGTLYSGDTTVDVASGYVSPTTGVYTLVVAATDLAGNTATETREFVIYDPNGGYVTGGGWFISPAGAYPEAPTLTGKASFGFVSKYTKGVVPNGQTEFHFQAAGLNFHSTAYDWLVVSGSKATFKGTGTIAGRTGSYNFTVVAVDDELDRVRIKIIDQATGVVVYDNSLGADETAGPTTALEGGSISVKKP